ncbi:MAG: acyl-CoA thioesterase [Smithella sp.]
MEKDTIAHSRSVLCQIGTPDQANMRGTVHGGEILKMMDETAFVVAQKHCHKDTVTAGVDEISFHNPIFVGNLITCTGELIYTSRSAMLVEVSVNVEDLRTEMETCALTAFFVMVALDEQARPTDIPPLKLTTDEERARFEEGRQRYEVIKAKPKVCHMPLA